MFIAVILAAVILIAVLSLIVGLLTGAAAIILVLADFIIFVGGIVFIVKLICDKSNEKEKK